jgi:group I intron endonuclease
LASFSVRSIADTNMADEPSHDERERDARSLEIQAQIESEARRTAWEQTYGPNRKKKIPMRGDRDQPSPTLRNRQPADMTLPAVSPPPTTTDTWAKFERISFSAGCTVSGIYGILHRASARIYVGSSINVLDRIRKHISDLEGNRHHSVKLQNAFQKYGRSQFEFLLIETVADGFSLRTREQHWIDQLSACAKGFNSKSQAEGPELSLETHIENAKRLYLPKFYDALAPERESFTPNTTDRKGFSSDLRVALAKKLKQAAITALLVWIGLEIPGLRLVWVAILFYFGPAILFDWPDTPKARSERRYFEAESAAMAQAEVQLIAFIADRLGLPIERVSDAYPHAERTLARRRERSDRYRRRNAELKRLRSPW